MTEQEIVTYVDTYINSINSLARSLNWCYFLAGIMFTISLYILITFIFDLVKDLIKDKKKQEKKSKKEEVEK